MRVGTFCSGTDAPIIALRRVGVAHTHIFSAESNKHARAFIMRNSPPQHLFGDVLELDATALPDVDLFCAGPPCQLYSKMNPRQVEDRADGMLDIRVCVLRKCLEFIVVKTPQFAVVENVIQLRKFWTDVRQTGTGTGEGDSSEGSFVSLWARDISPLIDRVRERYEIHLSELNPIDYGCPQQRQRLYVVMIKKGTLAFSFSFPPPIPLETSYNDILEHVEDGEIGNWEKKIVEKALVIKPTAVGVHNINVLSVQVCKDKMCLKNRPYASCLLSGSPSVVLEKKRRLTRRELIRLQGFTDDEDFGTLSYLQINKLVGNAMNINVLTHLFAALFDS